MNSSRVVVIDEDRDEALLMLSALGKAGIGAMYFKGDDEEQLPENPLTGVRVVFLDLKLLPRDNPEEYIPFTVEVLSRAVHIETRVTGIICWTKQELDVQVLEEELAKKGVEPAFVLQVKDKLGILDSGDLNRILSEVAKATKPMVARNLLTAWESIVHDATSASTASLLQLAADDDEMSRILAAIATGAAEERISNAQEALEALQVGLSAVQSDEIENYVDQIPSGYGDALATAVKQLRKSPLTIEQRARLNRALLTTTGTRPQPGNVYLKSGWEPADEFPFAIDDSAVRGILREFFVDKQGDSAFITAVAEKATPCLLELTPACDFAQGKADDARLLAGLLIQSPGDEEREQHRKLPAPSRVFAREVEFTWIENSGCSLSGSYKIIVNARRMRVLPFDNLKKHKAAFRLRSPVVSDIRAWLGAHAARPGYVAVH